MFGTIGTIIICPLGILGYYPYVDANGLKVETSGLNRRYIYVIFYI